MWGQPPSAVQRAKRARHPRSAFLQSNQRNRHKIKWCWSHGCKGNSCPWQRELPMFQFRSGSFCMIVVAALLSILCVGCGSSNSNSTNNNMSQPQAQAVAQQFSQAITQALSGAVPSTEPPETTDARPSLSTAISDMHPDALPGCTSTSNGQTCNIPISLTNYPCGGTQGGTISITGDVDGTLTNTGSGSLSAQLAVTPASCSVSNLIVNGDPSINVGGEINFSNNETPVLPRNLHRNRRHLLRPQSLRKLSAECHVHSKFLSSLYDQRNRLRPIGKWKLLGLGRPSGLRQGSRARPASSMLQDREGHDFSRAVSPAIPFGFSL